MKIKEQLHTFPGRDWTLFRAFPRLLVYVLEPLPLARLISLVSTVTGKVQLFEGYDHMRVEVLCAAGRAVRRAGGGIEGRGVGVLQGSAGGESVGLLWRVCWLPSP